MSHSKRNTSLAFFTAHERAEVANHWGSRATRLTRDSFLPFASCQLCLLPARDPVSCPSHGHLFCKECAVSNLLAQSKELKRLRKEAERRKLDDAEEQDVEDAEAQVRAVEEFERVQAGLSVHSNGKAGGRIVGRRDGKVMVEQDTEGGAKGVKRKLELDEDELKRLADDGQSKAKRRASGAGDAKSELPSFWAPSETPSNKRADLKAIKLHPTCPAAAADHPHDFTLKTLVTVHFTEDKPTTTTNNSDSDTPVRTCPSCNKALSNGTKAILAKPCGHVLCRPCCEKFQKAADKSAHDDGEQDETVRCFVCQEDVTPGRRSKRKNKGGAADGEGEGKEKEKEGKVERGLVELKSDGTGFAGGGKNMVKKVGVAFQC
ncbi:hypothetical protein LTR36_009679 [Oleoguttula mirabilis]|uniref:RING-type domain-containing protein n=1 Tax=Oleoguttula mirabilis TaxID=1507867 RepID=A0AAV9J5C6_9PEZI|nr:hypothetical protein LTR36_009679 [Oleoguttula mirabilis]